MLISHDRQFLFIHVPKTAGTSVTNCLSQYANRPDTMWENRLLAGVGIHVNHIGPWRRSGSADTAAQPSFSETCQLMFFINCSNSLLYVIRGICWFRCTILFLLVPITDTKRGSRICRFRDLSTNGRLGRRSFRHRGFAIAMAIT